MTKDYPVGNLPRELRTLRDAVRWGYSRFNAAGLHYGHGTSNGLDEAIALVLHALHLPHSIPDDLWNARLTQAEKEKIADYFDQRVRIRKPAAYITGEAWFAGLRFAVDERVLIPRSPIAELIEHGFSPWKPPEEIYAVLDLCTGSGCIAIASALYLPNATVDAADISMDALAVARRNVDEYNLEPQVRLWQADVFAGLTPTKYDVIVSNPPYVPHASYDALPSEFNHEPKLGLAAGEDGLDVIHRILARAGEFLQPDGLLIVEVGEAQEALEQAYPQLEFIWLDFERGGEGVFMLTAAQLADME